MKGTISDIVSSIVSNPKPVILFDTCILLDLVRTTEREELTPENISAAKELIKSGHIWLVASEIVETEWQDNIDEVERATNKGLKNLEKKVSQFKETVNYSQTLNKWSCNYSITSFGIEKVLKGISKELKNKLHIVKIDEKCNSKAGMRVINGLAPSSKGKPEYKDCSIIEHYLELSSNLKLNEFSQKIIFVTSNKNDFGTPYDTKEPIKTEFKENNIHYVSSLNEVIKLIT